MTPKNVCIDCGRSIGKKSKRCSHCHNNVPEHRAASSRRMLERVARGEHPRLGRKHSLETRQRMSESQQRRRRNES